MFKHLIILKSDGIRGILSGQRIGTVAINALNTIPGVEDPEIVSDSNEKVKTIHGSAMTNSGKSTTSWQGLVLSAQMNNIINQYIVFRIPCKQGSGRTIEFKFGVRRER